MLTIEDVDALREMPAARAVSLEALLALTPPAFCISKPRLCSTLSLLAQAQTLLKGVKFAYAVKACGLRPVLSEVAGQPLLAETQSLYEIDRVIGAGVRPSDIIWNGPRKSTEDLERAIERGVGLIVADNKSEATELLDISKKTGGGTRVGLRASMANSNPKKGKIRSYDKLGMTEADIVEVVEYALWKGQSIDTLHVHALSRAADLETFERFFQSVRTLADHVKDVTGFEFDQIDFGGGWDSRQSLEAKGIEVGAIVDAARRVFGGEKADRPCLVFELGRYVVEDAAFVVTRVVRRKERDGEQILIVDIGSNLLFPNPLARFWPTSCAAGEGLRTFIRDGSCMPSGVVAWDCLLPRIGEGEVVGLGNCGAYTASLMSTFYEPPAPILWCDTDGISPIMDCERARRAAQIFQGDDGSTD